MDSSSGKVLAVAVAAIIVIAGGWFWLAGDHDGGNGSPDVEPPIGPVSSYAVPFVLDFEDPVYVPSSLSYQLPLDASDVSNLEDVSSYLRMTQDHLAFLLENGLVGSGPPTEDPFALFAEAYEWIEEDCELPVFVTSDLMLDAYHLIFETLLMHIEETMLINEARYMSEALMWASHGQIGQLSEDNKHLAEENVVFFGAALRMLDPSAVVPGFAVGEIEEIVSLAEAAEGFITPPGFHDREDFTQYKPRSHYTLSEELSRYFRAMMWYGRLTFRGKYDDLTQRAVLASYAIQGDDVASSAHHRMSCVIDFIVGAPDDLTWMEYVAAAEQFLGPMGPDFAPLFDEGKLDALQDYLKDLRPPRILSDVDTTPQEGYPWGLRVFGQRYVPDSYIFQNCVYSKVPSRMLPSAIDVMAVLGSEEAWGREDFEAHAPKLEAQLTSLREEFDQYEQDVWNQTLYWAWLHSLQSLHKDTSGQGFPPFMQTDPWDAKELNTQLASWTQLTHDTLLYRKQSYTEYGGMPGLSDFVYVEPVPELYSRMANMVNCTLAGLGELSLTNADIEWRLHSFEEVLDALERVAVAELEGDDPESEDLEVARHAYEVGMWQLPGEEEPRRSKTVVVSDVHTDQNTGQCLEEAVGYVQLIVVVVPTEEGPVACVGGVFQHYEFARPLSAGRLTDEEWTSMLEGGTAPDPAPWAQDFIV